METEAQSIKPDTLHSKQEIDFGQEPVSLATQIIAFLLTNILEGEVWVADLRSEAAKNMGLHIALLNILYATLHTACFVLLCIFCP